MYDEACNIYCMLVSLIHYVAEFWTCHFVVSKSALSIQICIFFVFIFFWTDIYKEMTKTKRKNKSTVQQ